MNIQGSGRRSLKDDREVTSRRKPEECKVSEAKCVESDNENRVSNRGSDCRVLEEQGWERSMGVGSKV